MTLDDVSAGHVQELRRGTVVLACLTILHEPGYGYALLDGLQEAGFDVDASTLYPLLRRLERQELLTSEWNTDDPRPRKYYRTSREGERLREQLVADWHRIDQALAALEQTTR